MEAESSKLPWIFYPRNYHKARFFLSCYVAGVGYHDIEDLWEDLHVGDEIALVRQHGNSHDENAIAVAMADEYDGDPDDFDFDNCILGYIPKKCNEQLAAMLDMGWQNALEAYISEMNSDASYDKKLKINIYVLSKAAMEIDDASVNVRIHCIDDEEIKELNEQLWSKGYVTYRWGGFMECRIRGFFPNVGDKVVLIHRGKDASSLRMMNVCHIGDVEQIVDDCTSYVLANVAGPITLPNQELSFLNYQDAEEHLRPSLPLLPDISDKLINIFRAHLKAE